jgi:hypothetical protein
MRGLREAIEAGRLADFVNAFYARLAPRKASGEVS